MRSPRRGILWMVVAMACGVFWGVHADRRRPDAAVAVHAHAVAGADEDEPEHRASSVETSAPGAAEAMRLQHWQRDDGLDVVLVERAGGLVTFEITIRSGSMQDPADRVGLANLVGRLALFGTERLDRDAFIERQADLAAHFEVSTGESTTILRVSTLARNAGPVFALLTEAVRSPNLRQETFEQVRRGIVSRLEFDRDNDRQTTTRMFGMHEFGRHPYARQPEGSVSSVSGITVEDAARFHAAHWHPSNAIVAASGDIDRATLEALLATSWPADGVEAPAEPSMSSKLPEHESRRVLLVDRPERTQNQLLIGQRIEPPSSALWPAAEIASVILGGNFSSRLRRDIRADKGWTYDIGTELWRSRSTAALVVRTFCAPSRALDVIEAVLGHFERLVAEGATEDEVIAARTYVAGDFVLNTDTPQQLAHEAALFEHLGLGAEAVETFAARVEAIDAATFNAQIKALLQPTALSVVMLCTASVYRDHVTDLGGVRSVEIVPYTAETL